MSWSTLDRNQKIYTVMALIAGIGHLLGSMMWFEDDFLGPINLGVSFIFSGLGSLALIYLISFNDSYKENHGMLKMLLMIWTLINFIGWFIFHPGGPALDSSVPTKVIEAVLMIFLFMDMQTSDASEVNTE